MSVAGANSFRTDQAVKWNWGTDEGRGKVVERFEREVERTLKSATVKRKGSEDDPAYLIRQDDGDEVLKLGSELDGN